MDVVGHAKPGFSGGGPGDALGRIFQAIFSKPFQQGFREMTFRITRRFRSKAIRIIVGGDQPWFDYDDVRGVPGLGDTLWLDTFLDDWEMSVATVTTPEGPRQVRLLSLCGVYALISSSHLPATARAFKRWIATEVVPSLPTHCEPAVLPPRPEEGLCSTTEIADDLGMAPGTLGRRARHLKTAEHGERRPAVGLNSQRPVEQWFWNVEGQCAVLREFGRSGVRADRAA